MHSTVKRAVFAVYFGVAERFIANARRGRRLAEFEPSGDPWPPVVDVRALRAKDCPKRCKADPHSLGGLFGRYLGRGKPSELVSLVVDLDRYPTNAAFESYVRKRSSRTLPKVRKALATGYVAHRFPLSRHVHDIHTVRTSVKSRAFGPVIDYWLLKVEDVGTPAVGPTFWRKPGCPRHWTMWWGVFLAAPGHTQGAVEVDERLVAFVRLVRNGDIAHYAEVMGHFDHLDKGVMALLHSEIVRWAIESGDPFAEGLRLIQYGSAEVGNEGLLIWRKRAGFQPARLTLVPEE